MIYISCPFGQYTGGPTLAHQLCFELNKKGISSKMYYYGSNPNVDGPVHPNYIHFGNPYVTELDENTTSPIVITESKLSLVEKFPKAPKYIWWMSVDNLFISQMGYVRRFLKKAGMPYLNFEKARKSFYRTHANIVNNKSIYHLYQSEYARLFLLENGVQESHVLSLTDYIEEEIFIYAKNNSNNERKNIVLYNPKKGYEFTKKIIKRCKNQDISFVPLINMKKSEVSAHLCSSKLYIDFGTHPGKDRFPREAVVSGCCIITGRRGSAFNDVDIPIPDCYKFDDSNTNIDKIISKIIYIMNNYSKAILDYTEYKNKICNEQKSFEEEAVQIFSKYK